MENKIPLSLISLLSEVFPRHYSASQLSGLFMNCDFELLGGQYDSKSGKMQKTFAQINNQSSNPLKVLGEFISVFMERDDEYASKEDQDSIKKALAKYGLEYRLGKIAPINGLNAGMSAEEEAFLLIDFANVQFVELGQSYADALNQRLSEMRICINNNAPLSAVFMAGSTLEGILMSLAIQNPQTFNQAAQSPKGKDGQVLPFTDWTLANLIDTSHALGYLREDVKKFSSALRDFRNYIHPREQVAASFNPDMHTAKICLQMLCATISNLNDRNLVKES